MPTRTFHLAPVDLRFYRRGAKRQGGRGLSFLKLCVLRLSAVLRTFHLALFTFRLQNLQSAPKLRTKALLKSSCAVLPLAVMSKALRYWYLALLCRLNRSLIA